MGAGGGWWWYGWRCWWRSPLHSAVTLTQAAEPADPCRARADGGAPRLGWRKAWVWVVVVVVAVGVGVGAGVLAWRYKAL